MAMLIIILHHFCVHGILKVLEPIPYPLTVDNLTWQLVLVQLIGWGGYMSNGIFVVITGYYMFRRSVKYKKVVLLAMTMCFYSWFIGLIFYGGSFFDFSAKGIVSSMVPMWFGTNWFVSCYIIFFFFIPYINKLLESLTKAEFARLIFILFAVDTLLPAFKYVTFVNDSQLFYFCFMYCVGAYCRRYLLANKEIPSNTYWRRAVLISLLFLMFTIIAFDLLGVITGKDIFVRKAWHFVKVCGVFVTISMFCYFATMSPFYSALINRLAATTLGVYLIHENDLAREVIWKTFYPGLDYFSSSYFVVFMIAKVLAVYFTCTLIEQIRLRCIEPMFVRLIEYLRLQLSKISFIPSKIE